MSQYAFGHAVRIFAFGSNKLETEHHFQNFFISKTMRFVGGDGITNTYGFAPFGFSGVTVNRTGDGLEATIVFPNNSVTRGWAVAAIKEHYVMEVDLLIIDSDNKDGSHTVVHTYTGQVAGGQWDETSLNIQLTSVTDAVGTDIPRRSLTRKLIGNLPIANNVRLQ